MSRVGPVLIDGEVGRALARTIAGENADTVILERGGYLRVTAPSPCAVSRAAVEVELGDAFAFRRDLEPVMPSFQGQLQLEDEVARWH